MMFLGKNLDRFNVYILVTKLFFTSSMSDTQQVYYQLSFPTSAFSKSI